MPKILVLLVLTPVSMAVKDPFKFPCNAESTAEATLALCIKESATPASIAFMPKVFFLVVLRALRLGAINTH